MARNTFEHGCVLKCPTTAQPVDAAQMLPDVALAELVQLLVGPPELVLERKAHLGEGGFSVVFRGTLRGKILLFCSIQQLKSYTHDLGYGLICGRDLAKCMLVIVS